MINCNTARIMKLAIAMQTATREIKSASRVNSPRSRAVEGLYVNSARSLDSTASVDIL